MIHQICRNLGIVVFFFSLICSAPFVWAEPVTTIRNNGDSANRVDVVILGDGYTAAELSQYATDVEHAVQSVFEQEPFQEYQHYFNVHRVDVISNESGADHPERGFFTSTAFDATYNCANIQRLICVNTSKVNAVLNNSVEPNKRDIRVVIVNDPEYGGSGGALAVASIHSQVVELVLHELGHSFGLLADEYTTSPPSCNNVVEPPEPNITMQTQRDLIKWNLGGGPPLGWIDFDTPIPSDNSGSVPGVPGLYEGAKYCTSGLYRSSRRSKMRSLGAPFAQINEEQLVKRIYNFVSPLESSSPSDSTVTIPMGESLVFQAEVTTPITDPLTVTWLVNSQVRDTGLQFTLDSTNLNMGYHTVEVVVQDPTLKVRNDPANVLTENRQWEIEVVESSNGMRIPQGQMEVVSATSNTASRQNVLDGNGATFWGANGASPREMILDLGGLYLVSAFEYLPYSWTKCTQYEVFVSTSNGGWGTPVATGTWANDTTEKAASFNPTLGTFLKVRYLNNYCYAAEHNVVGQSTNGGDSTLPTIALTAPANGATVTGNVAVTAEANDSEGVVGVQFLLDGNSLGEEDLTFPYEVLWETGQTSSGSHTLAARARDLAGNTQTSNLATVNVLPISGGGRIPQKQMEVVSATSNTANRQNVLDGNGATFWGANGANPREMILDLGGLYLVSAFEYLPYSWTKCTQYEVFVSTSNGGWGTPVATGTWANDTTEKAASFSPTLGTFLKVRYLNNYCYAAEHNVVGQSTNEDG